MNFPSGRTLRPIDILYQDSWTVVVNKPSGLVVIPTPHKEEKTVTSLLNEQFSSSDQGRLHPCHRLDRETSGAMIFAWGKKNQKLLMDAFQQRAVQKVYVAFVHGKMKHRCGRLEGWVTDFDAKQHQENPKARWAVTSYEVLSRREGFSVVKIALSTGRTNQIRIQFAQLGHPLLGERKYAFAKDYALKFRRVALHAQYLAWTHPVTHKKIQVEAPLPQDMSVYLAQDSSKGET